MAFVACEKTEKKEQPTSLDGTTWRAVHNVDRGCELSFTAADYRLVVTDDNGETFPFEGTYTYNSPEVVIDMDHSKYILYNSEYHPGIVDGDTLTIGIFETFDVVGQIEFERVK